MITSTVRWVRSGDDRLHVGTADGLRLGWYDLRTGVTQLLDPAPGAAAEVQACVDSYLAATSPLRGRPPVHTLATRPSAPRTRTNPDTKPAPEDLHDRLPGEQRRPARRSVGRDPAPPAVGGGRPPATRSAPRCATPTRRCSASSRWRACCGAWARGGTCCTPSPPRPARGWTTCSSAPAASSCCARPPTRERWSRSWAAWCARAVARCRMSACCDSSARRSPSGCGADLPVAVRGVVVVVGARSVRAEGLPPGLRCACHDGSADKRFLTPCLSSTRVPQTRGEPAGQRRYSGR